MPQSRYVKQKVAGQRSAPINHKKVGATLRELKILPAGYRLGRLSKNQKDRIVKLAHRYHSQVNNPQFFVPLKIPKGERQRFAQLGAPIKGDVALLQRTGAESIRYDKRRKRIVRRYQGKEEVQELAPREGDIFEQADRMIATLKKGEYVLLKVGDKMPFGTRIKSMKDLIRYKNTLIKLYGADKWRELLPHLSLVVVKIEGAATPKSPGGSRSSTLKPTPSRTGASRKRSR